MLYDESDAMQDAQYEHMLQEFYDQHGPEIASEAIDHFQTERLQSYFVENPTLIEPAVRQLEEARRLAAAGFSASGLVFAASAIEVALKQAIFRPIVYGLVLSAPAAVIIAELSLGHSALDRFKNLLLDVLGELLGAKLREDVHTGSTKPLWEEVRATQDARNAIVHRAEKRSPQEAEDALRVASAVVETLYPAINEAWGCICTALLRVTRKHVDQGQADRRLTARWSRRRR